MTSNITIKDPESLSAQVVVSVEDSFRFAKLMAQRGEYREPSQPQRVVGHAVIEEPSYLDKYQVEIKNFFEPAPQKVVDLHLQDSELRSLVESYAGRSSGVDSFPSARPSQKKEYKIMETFTQNIPEPREYILTNIQEQIHFHKEPKIRSHSFYDDLLSPSKRTVPITQPDTDSFEGLEIAAQRIAARKGFFAGLEELLRFKKARIGSFVPPEKPELSDIQEAQRGFRRQATYFIPRYNNDNPLQTLRYGQWITSTSTPWEYGFAASLAKEGLTEITPEDVPKSKQELSWFDAGKRGALMCLPSQQSERQNHLYRVGLELWAKEKGFGVEDIGPRAEYIHNQVALQAFQYKHREKLGGLRR